MPTSKKEKNFEAYQKALLKLKDNLIRDIQNMSKNPGSSANESSDISGHVLHMADVATDMYDREFNLGLASNEREVLNKIDVALKRINDGSYGACSECGKNIPQVRLKAIPYVQTCLKCQEKLENES